VPHGAWRVEPIATPAGYATSIPIRNHPVRGGRLAKDQHTLVPAAGVSHSLVFVVVFVVGIVVRTATHSSRVGRRDNRDHRQQQSEERGKKKGCRLHFNVSFLRRAALCHSAASASVSVVLSPSPRANNLPRNRNHMLAVLQSCSRTFCHVTSELCAWDHDSAYPINRVATFENPNCVVRPGAFCVPHSADWFFAPNALHPYPGGKHVPRGDPPAACAEDPIRPPPEPSIIRTETIAKRPTRARGTRIIKTRL
jgi:hypothetical protein